MCFDHPFEVIPFKPDRPKIYQYILEVTLLRIQLSEEGIPIRL
ncbi:hypothetical protein PS834_00998 [Pseudomonas fluorescens]|nr:hypothetical protein PS834_00998 [Pseudomonas fluorescens]